MLLFLVIPKPTVKTNGGVGETKKAQCFIFCSLESSNCVGDSGLRQKVLFRAG